MHEVATETLSPTKGALTMAKVMAVATATAAVAQMAKVMVLTSCPVMKMAKDLVVVPATAAATNA